MVGFPNNHGSFPTKKCSFWGVLGVPPAIWVDYSFNVYDVYISYVHGRSITHVFIRNYPCTYCISYLSIHMSDDNHAVTRFPATT